MRPDNHLQTARNLAKLLDSQFSILGFRFGLDPLFDIIPGVGTLIPTALSLYIIWIGFEMQLPSHLLLRMLINLFADGIIGSIPVLGVVVDAIFKANNSNLAIIEAYLQKNPKPIRKIEQ